jgi:hypothetical protein
VPRAVLDTNIFVSALVRRDGTAARLVIEGRAGAFEFVLSPQLVAALREALGRDKWRRYFSVEEADAFIALISTDAVVRPEPTPSDVTLASDPDDQYLIDLAWDARVDALVTGDKALLKLRAIIPVMTPAEFMASIAGL